MDTSRLPFYLPHIQPLAWPWQGHRSKLFHHEHTRHVQHVRFCPGAAVLCFSDQAVSGQCA